MTEQQILQELEAILEALGVRVRRELLDDFPGGLCTLNGACCLFLDASARASDLARLCAGAVREKADLDTMYLKPEVRRFLENTEVPWPGNGCRCTGKKSFSGAVQ